MKEYQKAIKTYNDALEKDPENQEIIEAANKTMQLISNRTQSDPESVKKIVEKDPELQAILTDPVMQQVLREAQENPQSLNNYMNDTRIRDNLTKLFAAGILGRN